MDAATATARAAETHSEAPGHEARFDYGRASQIDAANRLLRALDDCSKTGEYVPGFSRQSLKEALEKAVAPFQFTLESSFTRSVPIPTSKGCFLSTTSADRRCKSFEILWWARQNSNL